MKLNCLLLMLTALFLIQCSQGEGRVRGKYCLKNHKPIALEKKNSKSMKVGEEYIIKEGEFDYLSSRIYINDLEREIRLDISHVMNTKTKKYETVVNCSGGSGLNEKMDPYVIETLIPTKIVSKNDGDEEYEISYKKVTFDFRIRDPKLKPLKTTYEDVDGSTTKSKLSDLYKSGTDNGRDRTYTKTETSLFGDSNSFEYITHTSLKETTKSSDSDPELVNIQMSVSFDKTEITK